MLDGLPVVREAFPRTVRLVSTARLRPPVLEALVSAEDAAALAEIEGATSNRLLAEQRGTEGIGRGEFIHGVPYASFVNAAFAYWKPREANRFNAARGAWYAALDVETCSARGRPSHERVPCAIGPIQGVVEYSEMFASMAGEFVDLRQTPDHPCLNPTRRRLSDRKRDRRRCASARTQRDHLSFRPAGRRNVHRIPAAARGSVRRARRCLSTEMVRRCMSRRSEGLQIAAGALRRGLDARLPPRQETADEHGMYCRAKFAVEVSASNWALTASVCPRAALGIEHRRQPPHAREHGPERAFQLLAIALSGENLSNPDVGAAF